jgi:FAD synthase
LTSIAFFLANFGIDVVNQLPKDIQTGIYYGWASVENGQVHKMVMSIGWNPYYDNEHKSMVSICLITQEHADICESFVNDVIRNSK